MGLKGVHGRILYLPHHVSRPRGSAIWMRHATVRPATAWDPSVSDADVSCSVRSWAGLPVVLPGAVCKALPPCPLDGRI